MSRVVIRNSTIQGFFARAKDAALRADNAGPFDGTVTLAFEDPQRMFEVLTQNRQGLVRAVMHHPDTIPSLARRLKRDRTAVTRDVLLLEKLGVVISQRVTNPGHGVHKLVQAAARKIDLVATIE
uniref:Transcriptional regulator n=1 Tax=mine drainage metagenome TaxID=410659 RepID=E6PTV5_9ZZZZ